MKTLRLLIALLLLCSAASAQEAMVRTHVNTKQTPWVGQKFTVVVELLSPGFFSGSPVFDLPKVPGLLIFAPEDHPVLGSETINGVSYTSQCYEFAVFARQAGDFEIPSFPIRFHVKHSALDKDSIPATVNTEALHFTANLPPGAENVSTLISSTELKADEQWKPMPAKAKTGDAFTRVITWSAADVPGMAFPPFPAEKIDGLGIYPKSPQVTDHEERGTLTGSRQDTIVYVCQQPGHYVIPAAHFTWWDTGQQQLRTIDFPERSFDVVPNPAFVPHPSLATRAEKFGKKMAVPLLAIVFLALCVFIWPRTKRFRTDLLTLLRPRRLAPLNPRHAGET